MVKEFPKVELFEIPLKNIQPSQFYVDKSKKKEVGTFIHTKEDVIIPLKKFGNEIVSMDGHTRMAVCGRERVGYGAGFLVSGRGRLFWNIL